MDHGPTLLRSLLLRDSTVPRCSLGIAVPWPVDERLARLAQAVEAEHLGPTSKHELGAALVQTAPDTALELWDRVLTYRRSTVGDAAFWLPDDAEILEFSVRKPGRRSRHS